MSGIYGIIINNSLVYIGKANDLEERKRQHWCKIFNPNENKYYLLHAALKQHFRIQFILLQKVPNISSLLDIEEKWIKALKPCLNSVHNNGRGKKIDSQNFFDEIDKNYLTSVEKYDII